MKIAYITNGDSYNTFFEEKYGKTGIPFSEALIQGKVILEIFSKEFFMIRANSHGVSILKYKEHLTKFINFVNELEEYSEIYLYFGSDAFCQINMLTILAFLEEKGYSGKLFHMQIDEGDFATSPLKSSITLGNYYSIYQKLLINKEVVQINNISFQKAYDLYLDYISNTGTLAQFIKNNRHLDREHLLKEIFTISRDYGLGDVQIVELIDKYKVTDQ